MERTPKAFLVRMNVYVIRRNGRWLLDEHSPMLGESERISVIN